MKDERRPLRFRGTPTRLLATFQLPEAFLPSNVCRVTLPDRDSLPLAVRRLRSITPILSTLSFRLPKSTPPGSYPGNAELGKMRIPIVVDVEPQFRLRFIPPKFVHRGRLGGGISAELTLLNLGNVEVKIPAEDTFCVFDNSGVARAFYRGLADEDADGKPRIDRIMDELAKAHGGLMRVTVVEGSGRLAPEEARELRLDLRFSHRLIAGHTYRGTWSISEASLEVEIELSGKSSGEEKG
jgi:hypothetical protein